MYVLVFLFDDDKRDRGYFQGWSNYRYQYQANIGYWRGGSSPKLTADCKVWEMIPTGILEANILPDTDILTGITQDKLSIFLVFERKS